MNSPVYVVIKQPIRYRQMTIEEFLFNDNPVVKAVNSKESNTRVTKYNAVPDRILELVNVQKLIRVLAEFNSHNEELCAMPRKSLYYEFLIPKKNGSGYRKISAPREDLKVQQRILKKIFEKDFNALYHTSAFAYIPKRCTLDAIKRHQFNKSKWFAKYDLSDFFGNTTKEFVMQQFATIFPFSEVMKDPVGYEEFSKAIDIAFLDGRLPQGTPISPLITNVMMIPIDLRLSNTLRDFNGQKFVYTRYADDFTISSKRHFNPADVQKLIVDTLSKFGAPFTVKNEKTRYGSTAGRNWNLGLMLTADNKITVGNKRKKTFQATISNYVMDRLHGKPWPLEDVQIMDGTRNYIRMIEGDVADNIVKHIGEKYGVDVFRMIKEDLKQ